MGPSHLRPLHAQSSSWEVFPVEVTTTMFPSRYHIETNVHHTVEELGLPVHRRCQLGGCNSKLHQTLTLF